LLDYKVGHQTPSLLWFSRSAFSASFSTFSSASAPILCLEPRNARSNSSSCLLKKAPALLPSKARVVNAPFAAKPLLRLAPFVIFTSQLQFFLYFLFLFCLLDLQY
jgi:hypothetical protein